jgi:hypothetical protein
MPTVNPLAPVATPSQPRPPHTHHNLRMPTPRRYAPTAPRLASTAQLFARCGAGSVVQQHRTKYSNVRQTPSKGMFNPRGHALQRTEALELAHLQNAMQMHTAQHSPIGHERLVLEPANCPPMHRSRTHMPEGPTLLSSGSNTSSILPPSPLQVWLPPTFSAVILTAAAYSDYQSCCLRCVHQALPVACPPAPWHLGPRPLGGCLEIFECEAFIIKS